MPRSIYTGYKKMATGRVHRFAKPAARRLRAKLPWNELNPFL